MEEKYNDIPVYYCTECLSLNVKTVVEGMDLDYCDKCGCTDINKIHIEDWRKLYREKYGFDFLTKELNNNGRERKN